MCFTMATVVDLRSAFKARIIEGIPNPPGEFHPLDLERVKDDRYLDRILIHVDNDLNVASKMLWDLMVWRKTVGANEINERTIRMDYVKEGTFFIRGRDIDGCLLLIIKLKKHVKGQKDFEEIKKILIYWLDRIEREENGKSITIFFDMEGCGLENMDMDLIKYLINLFHSYYPNFLNYIVIYQMPWILSAAFKVVKTLLPAKAKEIMKSCNKDNLKTIVAPEQALTCWGGKDPYVFEFVPEIHSADDNSKKDAFTEQDDNYSPGEMLRINPRDAIIFENDNDEVSGHFTITNMDESTVSFKIRTTAPEKFYVRPSSGTLSSGCTQIVHIVVQPGFRKFTVTKDRFLVMSVQIPKTDLTPKELAKVWQNSTGSKVDEYRLKCQFPENMLCYGTVLDDMNAEKQDSVTKLRLNYKFLHRNIRMLKIIQFLSFLMTSVTLILGYLAYHNTSSNRKYCEHM